MSMSSKFNGETRQIGCLFAGILVKFGGRYMSEAGMLSSCSITRRIVIYDDIGLGTVLAESTNGGGPQDV